MSMQSTATAQPNLGPGIVRRLAQVMIGFAIQGIVLFVSAWTLRYWEAWVYIGLYVAMMIVNASFLFRTSPETIVERGRGTGAGNWKDWDKLVALTYGVIYFLGVLILAGLDKRFGWSANMALWVKWGGIGVFVIGSALFSWAMITNAFFSTAVRIQEDRGHQVCTTGPYRLVRHPGYVGAIMQSIAAPLLLGSWWALIAGGLAAVLLVIRTALEDKTLHEELPGYTEFAQQTRYRLLPGIW